MAHRVPGDDRRRLDAGRAGHERPEVGAVGHAPQRAQVLLAVQHEAPLVDVAIEVDRELRDAQQRAVDTEQHFVDPTVAPHRQPPRQPEVAVEPRVEQHAAVDLDAELAKAGRTAVGVGLDAQVGRIGVGAHQAELLDRARSHAATPRSSPRGARSRRPRRSTRRSRRRRGGRPPARPHETATATPRCRRRGLGPPPDQGNASPHDARAAGRSARLGRPFPDALAQSVGVQRAGGELE